jgi:hypothetical protein
MWIDVGLFLTESRQKHDTPNLKRNADTVLIGVSFFRRLHFSAFTAWYNRIFSNEQKEFSCLVSLFSLFF